MTSIDVARVRRLARDHKVIAHPTKYHAGRHGIGFMECQAALENCYAVKPDPRHRDGWYALASRTHGRTIRIDFDLLETSTGDLLLVVTAYHV